MSAPHHSDTALRPFTVQLGYPVWYATTVVVEAGSTDEACRRAIEEAESSACWRSLDDCGSTFVERLAQGDDVDLWAEATATLPVPHAYAEHGEANRLREALTRLLDWAATRGSPEDEVLREAERALIREVAP